MRRIELNRKVLDYANKINFYNLGLIRKVLQLQEARYELIKSSAPVTKCPKCGCKNIDLEITEDYLDDDYLYCNNCYYEFDDYLHLSEFMEMLHCEGYINAIDVMIYFGDADVNAPNWSDRCEREFNFILETFTLDKLQAVLDNLITVDINW